MLSCEKNGGQCCLPQGFDAPAVQIMHKCVSHSKCKAAIGVCRIRHPLKGYLSTFSVKNILGSGSLINENTHIDLLGDAGGVIVTRSNFVMSFSKFCNFFKPFCIFSNRIVFNSQSFKFL